MMTISFSDVLERAARRAADSAMHRSMPYKCAFMHIPKCAGTSLMEALRKGKQASWRGHVDGPETRCEAETFAGNRTPSSTRSQSESKLFYYRQSRLVQNFKAGLPIISGHVPFPHAVKTQFPEYTLITIVRPPIARWLSHFNFRLRKLIDIGRCPKITSEQELLSAFDEYVASSDAIFHGTVLSTFFSEIGIRPPEDCTNRDVRQQGIDLFDLIGGIDDIDALERELIHRRILRSSRHTRHLVTKHNATRPISTSREKLTRDILNRSQRTVLERICEPDLEAYGQVEPHIVK